MQIVIIAGGKGTRLAQSSGGLPKAMVEVGGKPLLEHQILLGRKYGMREFLLLTGFGAEYIENYCGDGSRWSVHIRYHRDSHPLGTAGAVLSAFDKLEETFIVLYGDTMLNVDLGRMQAAHKTDAAATIFVHPNDHPHDSDLVELDAHNRVLAFHSYPHPPGHYFANLVNAALYIVSKQSLRPWCAEKLPLSRPLDLAKDLFPQMAAQGAPLYGYRSREYIKDAGTPERLDRVRSDYASGKIHDRSFANPLPAVFLDRDGTLNVDKHWIHSPDDIELLPGAAEAVRAINESGRLAVVITNQPVVARGECTEAELARIHNRLAWLLGESHAFLDAVYYCPHHPDRGFTGERQDLKHACSCRKPAVGLFEMAARTLNIDREKSWMIGDSAADIEAARKFGISSVLLRSEGQTVEPCRPHFEAETLLEAIRFVLYGEPVEV
jgi:D,D-heptose 1,7-bisphosphate phosphatase